MDNEVVVGTRLDADGLDAGASDFEARMARLKGNMNDLAESGEDAGAALGASLGGVSLTSLLGGVTAIGAAIQVGIGLWEEYNTVLQTTIDQHEKLLDTTTKWREQQEKGSRPGETLATSLDQMDPKVKKAMQELGYESMGYAAEGTWTRRGQAIVSSTIGASGLGGYFSGTDEDEEAFAKGKAISDRERGLQKNNEEKAARDKMLAEGFAAEMAEEDKRFAMKQEQQAKASVKADEDQEKSFAKEADKRLRLFAELERAEEQKAQAAQRFERQEEMRAISRGAGPDGKEFQSRIESFDATYNRIAAAAGSSKEDPHEKAREQREKIQKEQDALREKWHQEDMAKQDAIIEKIQGGLA